ncbi:MAG: enoyl-CoA hydratase/isomerase family protein, partial [Bdellovibrionales bacterium]|nr:enoyl-CoA hydratase/isomerase family protein [Bdellovibrionales bacterium]
MESGVSEQQGRVELGGGIALVIDEQVARLRLGQPEERAVTLNETRIEGLERAIARVAEIPGLAGLVIHSSRPGMFCAGADVQLIEQVNDPAVAEELARRGQEIFDRIAALPCTTVAVISGPCVGGGYELALACDYRVAVDSSDTK